MSGKVDRWTVSLLLRFSKSPNVSNRFDSCFNFRYHDATIESISDEGQVNVIFDTYQNRGESLLKDLRERKVRNEVFTTNSNK